MTAMKIADLVESKDGSLSLTKLAAATAHLNFAVAFIYVTYTKGFVSEMWFLYGGFAIGHAAWDKAKAMANARSASAQDQEAQK